MKRYDSYKDSGVKWIGEIPSHWEVRRLSQVAKEYFVSNKDIHHQNLLSLSYGRIIRKDIKTTKGLLPSSFDNYQVVRNGIIVLRLTDLQNDHRSLRVGLAREEGIVTSAYLSITCRNRITSEYLYEQLHCNDIHKVFYGMGDGLRQSLNWEGLRNLLIALPPLSEQRAIVSFLDTELGKIDTYMDKEQQLIERLKELKQSLIARAVTHGINPNVKMKPSGIDWIGEIPSHWKRCRNKDIMRERKDIVGDKANKYTLLSLTMNGVIIRDISEGKGKFPKDFTTYKIVRPGQMVFCLFDIEETPRTVGLVKNEGMLTGAYDVFDLRNVNGHYLYYYYESIDDRKALKPLYRGLRKTIPTPTFMSMSVCLPPLSEQRAIVDYLQDKTSKIDKLITEKTRELEYMKELRQRIISDAVTGKIDVRS